MGISIFRARALSTAAQVWDEEQAEAGAAHPEDDVVVWLDLPPDFTAPDDDGGAYRQSRTFDIGPVDAVDDAKWAAYMALD